ncbi:hypothetical protein B0H17DRAFT_1334942 [Mycena rosella]|uniref:Uncharacterized protein n=1 Tax=Mycena rosella TaxID=1033263 RepID=A0AAD7G7D8_MYCRO|nr:hypothetical protein B0H17DRAFT_1334942 [Mycena rosella]
MAPRGSRDNPDPTLIVNGSRLRKAAADPLNGEPAFAAMEALLDRIDSLSKSLPKTITKATRCNRIYQVITGVQGEGITLYHSS